MVDLVLDSVVYTLRPVGSDDLPITVQIQALNNQQSLLHHEKLPPPCSNRGKTKWIMRIRVPSGVGIILGKTTWGKEKSTCILTLAST
jgi:hypothetical protein